MAEQPSTGPARNKRIWAQDVKVSADMLQARLNALVAARTETSGAEAALEKGARELLEASRNAALRRDPLPGRVSNWWRGTLVEAAYQNLHAAECLMAGLYDTDDVEAEIPEAVARVESGLERDDPRRIAALELLEDTPRDPRRRTKLRKAIEVGFNAADSEYSRLRSFRNAVVGSALTLIVLLVIFISFVATNPADVPFCFTPGGKQPVCPSGGQTPTGHDILAIALLGVLGGLLSTIVSIRNMHGTSLAYDVPQALALLKIPLGALSAIGGLLVIRGDFIPGFSDLDSQQQILAYAFAFGVAQQLLIGLIDKRARSLLQSAPGKSSTSPRPLRTTTPGRGETTIAVPVTTPAPRRRRSRLRRAVVALREPSGTSDDSAQR